MIANALTSSVPPSLSLVMPVRNEGPRVVPALTTLAFTTHIPLEVVVVYDREKDPTVQVVRDLSVFFSGITLVRNTGTGIIDAIKTGFHAAQADIVGIWVAYHVDPFGLVNKMYELAVTGCDVVSGNRFNRIQKVSRGGAVKKLLSRGGNFLLNRMTGIPLGDVTTSIKLYRKKFLEENPIETTKSGGWAISTELAVKAAVKGYRLGEVEFLPQNTNLILGVSNFRVLGQIDQYLRWLTFATRNRGTIRKHYRDRSAS